MGELSFDDIIKEVDALPALSHVTYKVLQLTGDSKTTVSNLAETIAHDQVLTAKVLRMANSAYYGFSRKISGIKDALVILGFSSIRSLVLAISVSGMMDKEFQGYALPKGDLWRHSMSTALIARELSKKVASDLQEQAFVAGLLHDIGKVILSTYLKDSFQRVIEKVQQEGMPFMQAEQEILGFNHAEVGAKVAEKWNLPADLVETIAKHHIPAQSVVNPKLTGLIHVADALSMSMGMGLGADGMFYPFDGMVAEQLNLTENVLEETLAELADALKDDETFSQNQ